MKKLLFLCGILSITSSSYSQSQSTIDSLLQLAIDSVYSLRVQGAYLEAYDFMVATEQQLAIDQASCALSSQHSYLKAVCLYYHDSLGLSLDRFQEEVLPAYEDCWGEGHGETAYVHYMIGLLNGSLEEYYAGIDAFRSSANIYANLEDRILGEEAAVYQECGYLLHKVNDHASALKYLHQAESIYQSEIELDAYSQADFLNTYGIVLRVQGKTAEAEVRFLEALRLLLPLKGYFESRRRAAVYQNLSTVSLDYGRLLESRNYLESSIRISRDSNYQDLLAKNYDQLGTLEKRGGELDSAMYYYGLALDLKQALKKTELTEHVANTYENLGDIDVIKENLQAGIENYQLGIAELIQDARGLSLYANPIIKDRMVANRFYLAQTLDQKAQAYLQLSDRSDNLEALPAALEAYDKIDTMLNQIRQGLSDGGSKYILQEDIKKVYGKAIRSYLKAFEISEDQGMLERAYQFAAKNKALVLLEGLQDERAKSFAGIPTSTLRKERRLKKAYHELEAEILAASPQAPILSHGPDSLFRLRRAYQELVKELEAKYPRYYDLKYSFVAPVSIRQLQRQLGGNSALLEFFVGEESLFTFLITKKNWRYFEVEKPRDFESKIQTFRQIVQQTDPAEREAQFSRLSYEFYQQLLAQPLAVLEKEGKVKRLKIIPDEVLLQFPFDLLLTEPTDRGLQARTAPYLIRKYALSYSYSNQLAFANRRTRNRIQKARSGFAGFGLEYDDFTLKGLKGTGLDQVDGENREMGRLKYSDDEVLAAAEILGGETWINQEATKAAFLQQAEQYRILHLAMHALVDDEYPLNSALIFSRVKDSTDFMLKASDVYNMEIGADLAVLSACNTGFGTLQRGEGVRSMARAFTYAGCARLMATLWEASDYSTKDILLSFYEQAKKTPNTPIDVLLQQAKIDYLEKAPPTFTTPSYWAHLMILGDTLPLKTENANFFGLNGYYLAGALGGIILLLLLFRYLTKGKVDQAL
ncbi:MAG: CHAT domain-containing protein [Saprospiraceae bacterium]|nr:CHAT domain-containing protein [Saprospiraceae bacterium]